MLRALLPAVALVSMLLAGSCAASDEPSDQITRIDGPAVVDEDLLNGVDDDSSDG